MPTQSNLANGQWKKMWLVVSTTPQILQLLSPFQSPPHTSPYCIRFWLASHIKTFTFIDILFFHSRLIRLFTTPYATRNDTWIWSSISLISQASTLSYLGFRLVSPPAANVLVPPTVLCDKDLRRFIFHSPPFPAVTHRALFICTVLIKLGEEQLEWDLVYPYILLKQSVLPIIHFLPHPPFDFMLYFAQALPNLGAPLPVASS
jgi:hypothetical protein